MTHQRILIVDDDMDFRVSLGAVLRLRGYSVEIAASAEEAQELVREQSFGMALIDIVMPGRDGVACLDEILTVSPSTRIMLMTGFAVPQRIDQGLETGAAFVIHKPVDIPRLIDSMQQICRSPTALFGHPEPASVRGIKCALERCQFNVVVATHTDEVLENLKTASFGLVVVDLGLAGDTPSAFLNELAPLIRGVPALIYNAVTGEADPIGLTESSGHAAVRVIEGSMEREDLLRELKSLWNQSQHPAPT